MIQFLLFKWKSNISSPASRTKYPLFSLAFAHSAHTNTLLTGRTVPVHTIFPHFQQAQSISPACAYGGTRRERIASGNLDTAWPKIKPESVSANWKTSHSLVIFKMSLFHFANILGLAYTNPHAHLHEQAEQACSNKRVQGWNYSY